MAEPIFERHFVNPTKTLVEGDLEVTGQLTVSGITQVTPHQFGAVGDGVVDDTVALQAADAAAVASGSRVVLPEGDYVTSSTLTLSASWVLFGIVHASATVVLEGGASLTAGRAGAGMAFSPSSAYLGHATTYDTPILCGLNATWTGRVSGLTFTFPGNHADIYAFWVRSGENFKVEGNRWLNISTTHGGSQLGVVNNGGSQYPAGAAPVIARHGRFLNNILTFDVAATGMTEVYHSDSQAEDIQFVGNTSIGNKDDVMGIHGGQGIVFRGNYAEHRNGTVLIYNSTNVSVVDNVLVKRHGSGTSGGIHVAVFADGSPLRGGVISGNLIINDDAALDQATPIIIQGSEDLVVSGNTCINRRGVGPFVFVAQNSDSSSFPPTPTVHNRNLLISNNVVRGGSMAITGSGAASDGISVIGNLVDGGGFTAAPFRFVSSLARNDYSANNVGTGATTGAPANYSLAGAAGEVGELVAIFAKTGVTTTVNLVTVGSEITSHFLSSDTRLSELVIQFSSATPVNCYLNIIDHNGSSPTSIGTATVLAGGKAARFTDIEAGGALSGHILAANHALQLELVVDGSLGDMNVSVYVYGTKYVFH